jgi:type III restriction enzyme
MNLKDYQKRALGLEGDVTGVKQYLEQLAIWRGKARDGDEWLFDFAEKAWEKAGVGRTYLKKKDGLGRPLPVFCLKVPTGGGKTLLAVETIGLVQNHYRQAQAGLVVWIVPTLQIYRQTLLALKDRDHPYRQHLDILSAGRTLILEKTDAFTPQDVRERLCVLVLMLPSAARANKEALRMFKDAGAFAAFFPDEGEHAAHAALLRETPTLHTFESEDAVWGRQVKTSLGNVIQLCQPLIILDEGHKAYSETAQKTLRELNPCMIVELSATPPKDANKLVAISGEELLKEEMIKLDLHIVNKSSTKWRDTMRAAMERRADLEAKAADYEAETNVHIRPICLVQVERTGKEQRDGKLIHAEDVREYLLGQGVSKDHIAVKTADIDDLKDFEDIGGLLARDCPVRYIITKQALQEGWDCPFAYVLVTLTNPHSKTAMTQLIGRILRQPYARKTHIPALDESYIYCFQRADLMEDIRKGFKQEGLEDMQGRIVKDATDLAPVELVEVRPRAKFRTAAENMVLPAFVIRDGKDWRLVSYEADILSRVAWEQADVTPLYQLTLSLEQERDTELRVGLSEELRDFQKHAHAQLRGGGFDYAYAAAHLLDVVPNPWIGYEFIERVFSKLLAGWKGKEEVVANNFVFVLEEIRKRLDSERNRLAETVFNQLLDEDVMRFMVVTHDLGMHRLPKSLKIPAHAPVAPRLNGRQFEMSLFDTVPADSINSLEREVASFLEDQQQLYFWYRNVPHRGYFVQGWQRSKIFADFIFTTVGDSNSDYRRVFVVETKGRHLDNRDTAYKRSVFAVCNAHAKRTTWNELVPAMREKEIRYEVVLQDEWEKRLLEVMN